MRAAVSSRSSPLPAGERSEWARFARTFRVRGLRVHSEGQAPSPGSRKRDPTSPLRGEVTPTASTRKLFNLIGICTIAVHDRLGRVADGFDIVAGVEEGDN